MATKPSSLPNKSSPSTPAAFESWAPRMMDDKIIKVSPSPENRRQSSREQLRIASKRCSRSLQNSGAGCGVLTRALVQQQVLPGPRWLPTDPLSAPRQLLPFPLAESPWAPLGVSASTPFTSLGSRFLSTFFDFPFSCYSFFHTIPPPDFLLVLYTDRHFFMDFSDILLVHIHSCLILISFLQMQ